MSFGSLLWIHGKRKALLYYASKSDHLRLHSWVREERPLVCHFPAIVVGN